MPRSPLRLLRRVRHALARVPAPIILHPDYRHAVPGAPADALRGERILAFLLDERIVSRRAVSRPRPASFENLVRAHDAAYLRTLDRPEVVSDIIGRKLSAEQSAALVELQRLQVGGTVQATRLALRAGGLVVHLGGGFHHAAPDEGMGFCIFNDLAVAVMRIRARQFAEPIAIVDLDLHDGNGTRRAFATDPTVHTFSIHNADWDDSRAVADTRIALGTGVDDVAYLGALREHLPPVLRAHRPGLVLFVAGTDPAADDALGDWRITAAGMLERDRFVIGTVRELCPGAPVIIVLAGGYGSSAWRHTARSLSWLLAGHVVEPPDELALALRTRAWQRNDGPRPGWLDFQLSAEDVPGPGGAAETRLLGRYSDAAVAATLEDAGVLAQIRARGYAEPVVEVEPASGLGQTVRIFGDPGRRDLLVEVRLNRRRGVVPDLELLWVEWLMLQDPRRDFAPGRPPLPGQEHPGLGIFGDVIGWLANLCAGSGLDGIGFRSSHYHIAALSRRLLAFLRPGDDARFTALAHALDGRSLSEAAALLAAGRVLDRESGERVKWEEVPMVIPVSARLRTWLTERTGDTVAHDYTVIEEDQG